MHLHSRPQDLCNKDTWTNSFSKRCFASMSCRLGWLIIKFIKSDARKYLDTWQMDADGIKLNCPEMLRKALLCLSQLHFHRNDLLHLLEDLLSWNPFSPLSIWSSILRWIETANSKMSPWPTNPSTSRVLPQEMCGLLAAFKRLYCPNLFSQWVEPTVSQLTGRSSSMAFVIISCRALTNFSCQETKSLHGMTPPVSPNDTLALHAHKKVELLSEILEPCLSSPPNLHH